MRYPYLKRLPRFEYFSPKTLDEAISILSRYKGDVRPIAGGTDLLIKMKRREVSPPYLVGLKGISGLNGIAYEKSEGLSLGPLVTIHAIETSSIIKERYPVLSNASSTIGSLQIRNLGTVVGNVCNALPSADMIPALIVLGGRLRVISERGERIISIEEFIKGPGETILESDELVIEIQVPAISKSHGCVYIKHAQREAMDLAIVSVAVLIIMEGEICRESRICLGTVGPTPMRPKKAEEILRGEVLDDKIIREASEIASKEAQPRSTIRASAEYRREMIKVLTDRALRRAIMEIRS